MSILSKEHAQRIVETVAPGHRLASMSPAPASFTNDASILDCLTSTGEKLRLVVKLLVDDPIDAPKLAAASYYALRLVRAHGIPAPEPIYLDEAGALLGAPGIVTRFVEGRQESDRRDPIAWAETLARLLVRIHDISPSEKDRQHLFDGNHMALYILRGDEPERRAGHALTDVIYDTVREPSFQRLARCRLPDSHGLLARQRPVARPSGRGDIGLGPRILRRPRAGRLILQDDHVPEGDQGGRGAVPPVL